MDCVPNYNMNHSTLAPQQPLMAGTVAGHHMGGSVVNRSLLAPQQPILAGTLAQHNLGGTVSSPIVMSRRLGSQMGCATGCAPPISPCGVSFSERQYFLPGSVSRPFPVQSPPSLNVTEQFIGRKVDIIEHERVVRALEQRINHLEQEIVAGRKPNIEVPMLQSRVQTLESQLANLAPLQGTVEGLRAENRELERLSRDLEARLGEEGRAHAQLTEKCSRLAVESSQIDNELQMAIRDRDQLARQLGGAEQDLLYGAEGVREVKSQMQIRISQLEAELQELIRTLQLRDDEVKQLTCRLRQQDGGNMDFDRLKADNITLIREVERSADEIRHLEMEVSRLRAELSDCRSHGLMPPQGSGRPLLGVEIKMLDDALGNRDNVVVVHTITPHGPAEAAGIIPGDILKEWDGIILDSKPKFQRLVDQTPPGTRIILTVVRGKSILDVPVSMGAAPSSFVHHRRTVQSANQVDNVIQDASRGSYHSQGGGGGMYGAQGGSRMRGSGSRTDSHNRYSGGRYGY